MRWLLLIGIVTLHVAMAIELGGEGEESDPASVGLRIDRQDALDSGIHSLSKFAGNFYPVLSKNKPDDNLICSPISVSIVLSMLAFGARGNTKVQLDQTLAFSKDQIIEQGRLRLLIDRFNEYTEVELLLANKIYLSNNNIKAEHEFTKVLKNTFNSDLAMLDFRQSTMSSYIINEWVEDNTKKRIKNIIRPADVNADTALVLVNAVYFKGKWKTPFLEKSTSNRSFWIGGTTKEYIPTMYSSGIYNYGRLEDVDAGFIELPYKSKGEKDGISMFIILPYQKDGLKKLEQNFANITVKRLIENSERGANDVYLPKFKIESEIDLKGPLQEMGLTDMFTTADFSGIASGPPLYVSKIKQKAFFEIDEEGSEGAAVTGVQIANRFGSFEFMVNRPFVAMIGTTTGDNPVNLFTVRYTGK